MSAVSYPIAETADAALHAPKGFAEREREARLLAGGAVRFVCEAVGPAFAQEDDVLAAFAGAPHAGGDWKTVRPVAASGKARAPATPVNKDGSRWPAPKPARGNEPLVLWRLSVSYWRIAGTEEGDSLSLGPARRMRRDPSSGELDPRALMALAHQPMRAVDPQRPLDIGLFERRLPEAPHIIVPDE
jgi:hypothetical protein